MNWVTCVLFGGLLWISPGMSHLCKKNEMCSELKQCIREKHTLIIVADNFNGFIDRRSYLKHDGLIIFLQKNETGQKCPVDQWPQLEITGDKYKLHISKWYTQQDFILYVLQGKQCNATVAKLTDSTCNSTYTDSESCSIRCVHTKTICKDSTYDENHCSSSSSAPQDNNKYIINITTDEYCLNCNNPVKKPEKEFNQEELSNQLNVRLETEGDEVDAAQAVEVMNKMADFASSINESSASLTMGEGVTGILVRETEPEDVEEVSFAYVSPNDSINIVEDKNNLHAFSRSVTVSKEAFEKAVSLNVSVPFVTLFRFTKLSKDEKNSTVLGNEVLAVEMGTVIANLTNKISISFQNMTYKGIPSCQSWNGEGSRPNWTDDGCLTVANADNITCQCSHLTFFAILLTANDAIPSSDLKKLTIITQAGCGISMFFLSIVLFMHFLMRKTKASKATRILIHLVSAMFLLNFAFLINNFVADLKSSVGCKIMAALMHYFMLATFTWFAVQAFHLCLQLHMGGKIVIRHYILKVSVISWILPSLVGIVLLSTGKYGEQVIHTDDTEDNVAMCWITDNDVHYIVNIGYYALVFIFTFTTFIIILPWLFCLKRTNIGNAKNGKSIVTILGLCCMLGITWGFAFFAYGVLQIPAYYIFTVLNSFQGFFLFIYYYNTSHAGAINENAHRNFTSSSSTNTLKTSVDSCKNPYCDPAVKK